MRFLIYVLLVTLAACSFEHIAEVRINNNNAYAVVLNLYANNLRFTSDTISPYSNNTGQWNWSRLSEEKGSVLLTVYNTTNKQIDSYAAGNFSKGILANYIDVTVSSNQSQITLSD